MDEKKNRIIRQELESAAPTVMIKRMEEALGGCFSCAEPSLQQQSEQMREGLEITNRITQLGREHPLRIPSFEEFQRAVDFGDVDLKFEAQLEAVSGDSVATDGRRFGRLALFEHFEGPDFRDARLQLYAVTDADTRYVLGLSVSSNVRDESALLEALHMTMRHKATIAADAGAANDWAATCLPDAVSISSSAPFVTSFVADRLAMLNVERVEMAATDTQARHPLEWMARELSKFMTRLPETMTLSEACEQARDFLVRQICDNYHDTALAELGGETPHRAYLKSAAKHTHRLLPNWRQLLIVFGVAERGIIGEHGIEFAGMIYAAPELLSLRQKGVDAVWFKYDPKDMRAIAFKAKAGIWGTAPSSEPLAPDISIKTRRAAHYVLARTIARNAAPDVINEAIEAARKASG